MPHLPRRRRIQIVLFAAALFAAFALPAASGFNAKAASSVRACAHSQSGRLRLAPKPRKCHRGERVVVWGVQGPRGPRGAPGANGPKGETGAQGPQGPAGVSRSIFSAQATSYLGALSPSYAPVTGIAPVTSTESQAQTLSPAAAFTATNLSVRASSAPGIGNSVTVTLRVDGADTELACTISASATTCTGPASVLVGGASALSLKVSSTPTLPATSLLVGFDGA